MNDLFRCLIIITNFTLVTMFTVNAYAEEETTQLKHTIS